MGSIGDSYDKSRRRSMVLQRQIDPSTRAMVVIRAVEVARRTEGGSTTAGSWIPSASSRRPKPRSAIRQAGRPADGGVINETASDEPRSVHQS